MKEEGQPYVDVPQCQPASHTVSAQPHSTLPVSVSVCRSAMESEGQEKGKREARNVRGTSTHL